MLQPEEKKNLINLVINNSSCPASIVGELNAFREGIVSAVNVLSGVITLNDNNQKQEQVDSDSVLEEVLE